MFSTSIIARVGFVHTYVINVRFYFVRLNVLHVSYMNVTGDTCHNFDLAVFKSTPTPLRRKVKLRMILSYFLIKGLIESSLW